MAREALKEPLGEGAESSREQFTLLLPDQNQCSPSFLGMLGVRISGLDPRKLGLLSGWDTDPILPPEKTPTESRQAIRWVLLALHRDSKKIEPTFLNYATSQ